MAVAAEGAWFVCQCLDKTPSPKLISATRVWSSAGKYYSLLWMVEKRCPFWLPEAPVTPACWGRGKIGCHSAWLAYWAGQSDTQSLDGGTPLHRIRPLVAWCPSKLCVWSCLGGVSCSISSWVILTVLCRRLLLHRGWRRSYWPELLLNHEPYIPTTQFAHLDHILPGDPFCLHMFDGALAAAGGAGHLAKGFNWLVDTQVFGVGSPLPIHLQGGQPLDNLYFPCCSSMSSYCSCPIEMISGERNTWWALGPRLMPAAAFPNLWLLPVNREIDPPCPDLLPSWRRPGLCCQCI